MTLLSLQVFAEGRDQEVIRSDKKMTVIATKPEEHSYLSLEVEHQYLQPGEALKVTLRDITSQGAAKPTFIYFMVRIMFFFGGRFLPESNTVLYLQSTVFKIIISTTGLE